MVSLFVLFIPLFIILLLLLLFFWLIVYRSYPESFYNVTNQDSDVQDKGHDNDQYLSVAPLTDFYKEPQIMTNILTEQECDFLRNLAQEKGLHPSQVSDYRILQNRSSKTAWIKSSESDFVNRLYEKIEKRTGFPKSSYEDLQVVYYEPQDYFHEHYDQCLGHEDYCKKELERFGGPRLCTLLIYLNDPKEYEGGHTLFPKLSQSFKEKKGSAILFYNLNQDETRIHPNSLHRGEKIKSGNKWVANIWIRTSLSKKKN